MDEFARGPVIPPVLQPFPHDPRLMMVSAPKVKRGDVRAAALVLLAERPRNGYQIIQEVAERSRGIWRPSPGSVYPALQQLEDEGLVVAEQATGRRMYQLTEAGLGYVAEHGKELAEPWAEVAESVSEELVDLRVLLGQVGMAMSQVVQVGNLGQQREARKVLAGARRALYRILADGDDGAASGGASGNGAETVLAQGGDPLEPAEAGHVTASEQASATIKRAAADTEEDA